MGLFDTLKGYVQAIIPDLLGDGSDVSLELPAIQAILEDTDKIFADGFQWADIPALIGLMVPRLMVLASDSDLVGATGEERKAFVVDAGTVIYFHYNPDWPWVPDFIENPIEKRVVPAMISGAVEAAFKLHKMIKDKVSGDDGEE